MSDRLRVNMAMYAAMPAGYGQNKRIAFTQGFQCASYGKPVIAAPHRAAEWRRVAWRAGYDAYHAWAQASRTPTPAILFGHDGTTGGNDDPNG